MELVVRKNDLLKELSLLQGIVERKNTIPILANVLINAEKSGVSLLATDLDGGISVTDLARRIDTDGSLPIAQATLQTAASLREGIWGQGFPGPSFADEFVVAAQRVVGARHLKLRLKRGERLFDGILFGHIGPLPEAIRAVYRFEVNEFNGQAGMQLTVEHWEPL